MLIEIDVTALDDASKEELINWRQGIESMIDIQKKRGNSGAVRALEVCKRFIDEELDVRKRRGRI